MKLLFTLLSLTLLVSCTITKRHFGPGYYVEWKKTYFKETDEEKKTDFSDLRTDVSEEPQAGLLTAITPVDSTGFILPENKEAIIEESETDGLSSERYSERKNEEVPPLKVDRKVISEEPEEEVDQPKRKVDPFTWPALGSLVLALLLLVTIGFGDMIFTLLIVLSALLLIFSVISFIRVVRHPERYKAKGLTWTLFMLSMAGTGIGLFLLIFYLLVITNNVDLF